MTQLEKTLIQNLISNAIATYNRQDLKEIATNDYALEIIIDKLLENQNILEHIKNIIK